MTPELIIALSGFLTGLISIVTVWRRGKTQARRDEVTLLREEVGRLQKRVRDLEHRYEEIQSRERFNINTLMDYVAVLRRILIEAGMTVPPIPKLRGYAVPIEEPEPAS